MRLLLPLAAIIALLSLTNCSSDSGGGAAATTQVKGALDVASTKITSVIPDTSNITPASLSPKVALGSDWTDSDFADGGDFGTSPQNFVLRQGDSTAQSSLMYRLNQAMENLCLFSTALPSTNGVIDLNSGSTVELTAAVKANMASVCGVALDQMPADGTVVGYAVEDISAVSGSAYERKVSFDMEGGTDYLDFFYYTISGSDVRFAYQEISSVNDSLIFFDYNSATGISRMEFSEKQGSAATGFELHYRILLDENNDEGLYIANLDSNGDTADEITTAVVKTQEGGGDQLVVSYTHVDSGANDITDGNACISTTDFSIVADNSLSCTTPAITGVAASTFTADVSGITAGVGGSYILADADETTFINFTNATDIFTAALAN